jgi:hypothetical protein
MCFMIQSQANSQPGGSKRSYRQGSLGRRRCLERERRAVLDRIEGHRRDLAEVDVASHFGSRRSNGDLQIKFSSAWCSRHSFECPLVTSRIAPSSSLLLDCFNLRSIEPRGYGIFEGRTRTHSSKPDPRIGVQDIQPR